MAYYVDDKGEVIHLVGDISAGINFDINGNEYFFMSTPQGILDVRSGTLLPSASLGGRHTFTVNGTGSIATAQSKFGGASYNNLTVAATNYIEAAEVAGDGFGGDDFAIELFGRNTNVESQFGIMMSKRGLSSQLSWTLYHLSNTITFAYSTDGTTFKTANFATNMPVNTWYHITVARNGTDLNCYIGGAKAGSTYNIGTDTIFNSTSPYRIAGDSFNAASAVGYIDEVRVSQGTNRGYTGASITPPSSPFSADASAIILCHMDGDNESTTILDSAWKVA